jgi:hypothetical protein
MPAAGREDDQDGRTIVRLSGRMLSVWKAMPYKFNESRRHKIPQARYRVTNWPDYEAALIRRGSLTVWLTEEAVQAWHAPATGERGGQLIYSAIARPVSRFAWPNLNSPRRMPKA